MTEDEKGYWADMEFDRRRDDALTEQMTIEKALAKIAAYIKHADEEIFDALYFVRLEVDRIKKQHQDNIWRDMNDIQKVTPMEGQLVLGYDPKNYNGLGDAYIIGRWYDDENALVHHSGYKYCFQYWIPLGELEK